jgi:hypothetical protein
MKIGIRATRVAGTLLAGLACVAFCAVAGAAGAYKKFVSRDTRSGRGKDLVEEPYRPDI